MQNALRKLRCKDTKYFLYMQIFRHKNTPKNAPKTTNFRNLKYVFVEGLTTLT